MKVGDKVTRWLAGSIPMELTVTAIEGDRFMCGDYTFDMKTGAEIDEDLGWGPPPAPMTGSFVKMPGVKYGVMSDEEALAAMPKAFNAKTDVN